MIINVVYQEKEREMEKGIYGQWSLEFGKVHNDTVVFSWSLERKIAAGQHLRGSKESEGGTHAIIN